MNDFRDKILIIRRSVAIATVMSSIYILAEKGRITLPQNNFTAPNLSFPAKSRQTAPHHSYSYALSRFNFFDGKSLALDSQIYLAAELNGRKVILR